MESSVSVSCCYCPNTFVMEGTIPEGMHLVSFACKFCAASNTAEHLDATFVDDEFVETWTPTYAEYMKSPEWKRIRSWAIEAAGGCCQLCNSDLLLQVHHRKYPHVLGWERPQDLTVLCRRCHELFHNAKVG